jgi:hypothetical protein
VAQTTNRCRALQGHCAISGSSSACAGVSRDDANFFDSVCMSLPATDQMVLIDESRGCDDIDPVPLRVSFAMTPAEVSAVRNAKP